MRAIAIVLFGFATACVSTSDHERLQRRYQLLEIEKRNALHAKSSLEKDLEDAQGQIASLEGRVASSTAAGEDKARAVKDLEADLTAAQNKIDKLEAQLGRIYETLAAGKLDEGGRQALLKDLTPPASPGAPTTQESTSPDAPGPQAATH
jgi:peptidoglycan hydrolase CwlO-like protein